MYSLSCVTLVLVCSVLSQVKNKVTFLKWACAFVNHVSGESTPMDCKDSALQRIHFPIPKEEEKDTSDGMESSGPWDALIYMKDPSALM